MTNKTKKNKKTWLTLNVISWLVCFGFTAFLLIRAFTGKGSGGDGVPLREQLGAILYTFIITNIPLIVLSLIVKDKIKPVCWMLNVIFANEILGNWSIYLVFGLWLFDNYVLTYLKDLFKDKYRINKEIDAR